MRPEFILAVPARRYGEFETLLKAKGNPNSPERALEIVRHIQYHQLTLHRRHTAAGLSSLTPEQRELFTAVYLPESTQKARVRRGGDGCLDLFPAKGRGL